MLFDNYLIILVLFEFKSDPYHTGKVMCSEFAVFFSFIFSCRTFQKQIKYTFTSFFIQLHKISKKPAHDVTK